LADIRGVSGKIPFSKFPRLSGERSIVSPADSVLKFQLHSYLVFYDGIYWCMWSQGPPVEDEPGQEVRYATSSDGLTWSEPRPLTGPPPPDHGYIARGFWIRDATMYALVARYQGKGAFSRKGKPLQMQALEWDMRAKSWGQPQRVFDDAIINFPPEKMPNGEWLVSRRDSRLDAHMMIGGRMALDEWLSVRVVARHEIKGFVPDEPIWWPVPDGRLAAIYRDNSGSTFLFRSFSSDSGRTWTPPAQTNFPNSPSKVFSLPIDGQCRALISNANPDAGRRRLYLATTGDGLSFTRLAQLGLSWVGISSVQYPHAIAHDGHVLVTYSRGKAAIEAFRIPVAAIKSMCGAAEMIQGSVR
jgi:hypothetical protein